jgi:hypothetical protein
VNHSVGCNTTSTHTQCGIHNPSVVVVKTSVVQCTTLNVHECVCCRGYSAYYSVTCPLCVCVVAVAAFVAVAVYCSTVNCSVGIQGLST